MMPALIVLTSNIRFSAKLHRLVGDTYDLRILATITDLAQVIGGKASAIVLIDVQSQKVEALPEILDLGNQTTKLTFILVVAEKSAVLLNNLSKIHPVHRVLELPLSKQQTIRSIRWAISKEKRVTPAVNFPTHSASPMKKWHGVVAAFVVFILLATFGLFLKQAPVGPMVNASIFLLEPDDAIALETNKAIEPSFEQNDHLSVITAAKPITQKQASEQVVIEATQTVAVINSEIANPVKPVASVELAEEIESIKTVVNDIFTEVKTSKKTSELIEAQRIESEYTVLVEQLKQAMKEQRLLSPSKNNALYYLGQMRKLYSYNPIGEVPVEQFSGKLLQDTWLAISKHQFDQAKDNISALQEIGLIQAQEIISLKQMMKEAQVAVAASKERSAQKQRNQKIEALLRISQERINQKKFIAPAQDSAKYYLTELGNIAPSDPRISDTVDSLIKNILRYTKVAIDLERYDVATTLVSESQQLSDYKQQVLAKPPRQEVEILLAKSLSTAMQKEHAKKSPAYRKRQYLLSKLQGYYEGTCSTCDFTFSSKTMDYSNDFLNFN